MYISQLKFVLYNLFSLIKFKKQEHDKYIIYVKNLTSK